MTIFNSYVKLPEGTYIWNHHLIGKISENPLSMEVVQRLMGLNYQRVPSTWLCKRKLKGLLKVSASCWEGLYIYMVTSQHVMTYLDAYIPDTPFIVRACTYNVGHSWVRCRVWNIPQETMVLSTKYSGFDICFSLQTNSVGWWFQICVTFHPINGMVIHICLTIFGDCNDWLELCMCLVRRLVA